MIFSYSTAQRTKTLMTQLRTEKLYERSCFGFFLRYLNGELLSKLAIQGAQRIVIETIFFEIVFIVLPKRSRPASVKAKTVRAILFWSGPPIVDSPYTETPRGIQNPLSCLAHTQTEIDLLETVDEVFVEPSQAAKLFSPHEQGSFHRLEFSLLLYSAKRHGQHTVEREGTLIDVKSRSSMPDEPLFVQCKAADHADPLLLGNDLQESLQPA